MDTVFIADDSEWDTSSHISQEVEERTQDDVISHQYVVKLPGYPAMKVVLYRYHGDKLFSFWDMLQVIRFYLSKIKYHEEYTENDFSRLAKQLGRKKAKIKKKLEHSLRIPPITWVGFFGGVDVTAYYDWRKYADKQAKKTDPHFINLNKQEFFSQPYGIEITNPSSRRKKYPVTISFVDTMALGPQGGLAALGDIVGQPKLNTKKWDLEDDLISYHDYVNPNNAGYYKQHMRDLLDSRPDDYLRYSLTDSVVTLKYLNFLLGAVIDVYKEGLIKKVHIPVTLTSLADEIASHFSHLPYDNQTITDIYNSIFEGIDVNQYLRPASFNQRPPRNKESWRRVLTKVVTGAECGKDRYPFGSQRCFIKQFGSYLARGSVTYCISKTGHLYQQVIGSASSVDSNDWSVEKLFNCIDFNQLYKDNPKLNIDEFDTQKVKPTKRRFNISTMLINHYADHAHQFIKTRQNVPPTINDILNHIYDDSIYRKIPWFDQTGTIDWSPINTIGVLLDFDGMRKGYGFIEPKETTDSKHQRGAHDRFSVQPDNVYNDGYGLAVSAYVGGMNLSYNPGIIDTRFKWKLDVDLKSSYVNAGHLIPDFRLDCKPLLDMRDLNTNNFIDYVNGHPSEFLNGPFTVGICNVSYHFPDDTKRVPVGYKPPLKDQGPVYVQQANRVSMTLTDVFDIIKHGGSVRVHRLIIPVQKLLTGETSELAPIGKMQAWSLRHRNQAKNQRSKFKVGTDGYRKYDSLQLFYKLLGNGGYGKSGQGLGTSGTRDFLTDKSVYVPFSRNTNPYTAAQYTSIARYQVNGLMDLMEKLYPDSLIPSVTTDGFIFCTNNLVDTKDLRQGCENTFDKRWVRVSKNYFNGEFFELKSHNIGQTTTTASLFNVRTRFNMTKDGHIKALVGLQPGEWPISRILKMLDRNIVTFEVDDMRIQSLTDMKHRIDHKQYVSMLTWQQPKYLNLSPDDTYQPTGFILQGEFGYYLTKPFLDVDELMIYREELKPYRSIFPAFRKEYAKIFMSLDQSVRTYRHGSRREKHVSWVHDDVPLKGRNYLELIDYYHQEYVPQVMLRYIAQHQDEYNLKEIYQRFFINRYKRFSSFKQALKRNKDSFVNPMCMIKEKITNKFSSFEI